MRPGRLALFAALALVGGCPRAPEPDRSDPSEWPISRAELERSIPTDDPAETSYRTSCLPCHGVDGRGAGGVTGADFTSPTGPLSRPDAELLISIRDGRRGAIGVMPAHGAILGEEGCAAVLAYVRRTFGPTIVPAPVEIDAGLELSDPSGTTSAINEGAPGIDELTLRALENMGAPPAGDAPSVAGPEGTAPATP